MQPFPHRSGGGHTVSETVRRALVAGVVGLGCCLVGTTTASAQVSETPETVLRALDNARPDIDVAGAESEVPLLPLPTVDMEHETALDETRIARGLVAHYAAVLPVAVDPWNYGVWLPVDKGLARWSLRIASPGALSLSLAFTEFELPEDAELSIKSRAGETLAGPFSKADNEIHRQLWTPPLTVDELVLSLDIPMRSLDTLTLKLSRVHHGYAGFGQSSLEKSGPCHKDLVCSDREEWQSLGRAVGLISVEGVRYCTGFLINNTAQDRKPFFVTARHCGVHANNAASVVVMWEHAASECGVDTEVPQVYRSFQTGAFLRASHRGADLTLLELDDAPNMEQGAYFLGWDRSFDDPLRGFTIHHPNTDRRRVAVTRSPIRTTHHLGDEEVRRGDHLKVGSWDVGTTEGGSSGAPLINEDLRVVGALHGGHASCGNRDADWFGRLSTAWDDGNTPVRRFRDWLDPLSSGAVVLDGLATPGPTPRPEPEP